MVEWISKANKKPEKFCTCLVYGPLLGMDVAHYNNNSNEFYCRTYNVTEYVTHWSELPDKPSDECGSIAAHKKQTYADRIRSMNDEQLAEMFVKHDAKCYLEGHLDKTGYLICLQEEAAE